MKYRKGYKYQIADDEVIPLSTPLGGLVFNSNFFYANGDGFLVILNGYAWDGVSGPTIDTESTYIPGLGHDALSQAVREGLIPDEMLPFVHKEFNIWLWKMKMVNFRRWYYYEAVKKFGNRHAQAGKTRKVYEVNFLR